jgi:glyoxylate reductase
VISVVGVGYDNVDVDACTRHNVFLANAPVLRESCADMALLLMLSAMREAAIGSLIAKGADPYPHNDRGWDWKVMRNVVGQDPGGKTLGLIGLGRIGQTFAAKAQAAFNMKVIYFDPVKSPPVRTNGTLADGGRKTTPYGELDPPPQWVSFEELLATSDVISMHANLSKHSRQMMGMKEFKAMKTTAYFVNMARGGLVDEEALAAALHAGEIAGAGLDTFEEEPKVSAALRAEPRAFLLPHIASATDETRFNMSERCACCQHRVRPTAAVFLSRTLRFGLACTERSVSEPHF